MRGENNFQFYEVATRAELNDLLAPPPAYCYVREDGTYYFKYRQIPELQESPFFSGFNDWHNMCSPCPRFDRQIHHVSTRWLNDWDLDWYPDLIDTRQGFDQEEPGAEYFINRLGPYQSSPSNGHNTVITNLRPGDLILRTQKWSGVIVGNYVVGDFTITVDGIGDEIADKFFSSRSLPGSSSIGDMRARGFAGTELRIDNVIVGFVIDHDPHYERTTENSPYDGLWNFLGEPTTTLHLKWALQAPIADATPFTLVLQHWYVVSCENLGSDVDKTEWEQPQFCDGHQRRTLDFHHLDFGQVPARYEAMLHTISSETDIARLFEQKKIVPGDLLHHDQWHNWVQVLPKFNSLGVIRDDEVSFADFSRTLTVFNREEFDQYRSHFDLNNLFVINLSHERQRWAAPLNIGFDADGYIVTRTWGRYAYRPADFIYYAGSSEAQF